MPRHFGRPLAAFAAVILAAGPAAPGLAAHAAAPSPRTVPKPVIVSAPEVAAASTGHFVLDVVTVTHGLVASGVDPVVAAEQVALLTAEDLAVLAAHPAMLQPAGNPAAHQRNLILGLLLAGAIVGLAIASDGSSSIMVN